MDSESTIAGADTHDRLVPYSRGSHHDAATISHLELTVEQRVRGEVEQPSKTRKGCTFMTARAFV